MTPDRLQAALAGWLPHQRWFAGKGRPIAEISVVAEVRIELPGGDVPDLAQLVVAVSYEDHPDIERYQVFVGYRRDLPERLAHMRIGEELDGRIAYDALWDDDAAAALLQMMSLSSAVGEALQFSLEPDVKVPLDGSNQVAVGEQSNTSIIFGDAAILKVFRLLTPGVNPELEVGRALRGVGCAYVPELLGAIEGTLDGEPMTYATLSAFEPNAADGWTMATASVRDLIAEADLRADEVGGDFAAEAHRLGEAVANVHVDLARALGTAELDGTGQRKIAELMVAHLDAAIDAVPELAEHAEPLRAALSTAEQPDPIAVQRVHGDLHLGQALRTPNTWLLIDFEGEPARPLVERARRDSPLRDVAGMLRSFDYAAHHLLVIEQPDQQLDYRALEWADRNREAFCAGYSAASGTDPRDDAALLRAYELDKAVYEAVYEARHRPHWLEIPLRSIDRLLNV